MVRGAETTQADFTVYRLGLHLVWKAVVKLISTETRETTRDTRLDAAHNQSRLAAHQKLQQVKVGNLNNNGCRSEANPVSNVSMFDACIPVSGLSLHPATSKLSYVKSQKNGTFIDKLCLERLRV